MVELEFLGCKKVFVLDFFVLPKQMFEVYFVGVQGFRAEYGAM